jgi:DNA topoisomerase-1
VLRLRQSRPELSGIARRRRGHGYSYSYADGTCVDDATRARIRDLAIPPAWQSVWICPYPNGHIQVVGLDAAGRRQYIYHEQWRAEREAEKHDRVLRLGALMPRFRASIDQDLCMRGATRERAQAAALRLLDRGVFRIGNEEYTDENGSYGVATLLRRHVRISKGTMYFDFPAKSNIRRTLSLTDPPLAVALRALARNADDSRRLLVYRAEGEIHHLTAVDVNARFKELVGEEFSVKDLRTWNATVLAAVGFALDDQPGSERARARVITAVMREVSEELGNTPAIARKSYVDPRVVDAFTAGETIVRAVRRAPQLDNPGSRLVLERAVMRLIEATRA